MSTLLCLPGRIAGDGAVRYFRRPRLLNLLGLLAPEVRVAAPDDPSSRVPPFVERLWMPAYAICLQATARQQPKSLWTSVDGWSGQCSILECVDELVPREIADTAFAPKLTEGEAVAAGRAGLLRYILAQRGQSNKPVVGTLEEIRLYHAPVWAYYYRRSGRYIDVKVLDGCTGKSAGAKVRVAVLNALVATKKTRDALTAPEEPVLENK